MITIQSFLQRSSGGRFTAKQCLRGIASNIDEPKLTKSDEVKIHSVYHCAVEKTPITAQLWTQRSRGRQSIAASNSVDQPPNSYVSRVPLEPLDKVPTFLMDKTSKESRLTIKYKFSNDGRLHIAYLLQSTTVFLDAYSGRKATYCRDLEAFTVYPSSLFSSKPS